MVNSNKEFESVIEILDTIKKEMRKKCNSERIGNYVINENIDRRSFIYEILKKDLFKRIGITFEHKGTAAVYFFVYEGWLYVGMSKDGSLNRIFSCHKNQNYSYENFDRNELRFGVIASSLTIENAQCLETSLIKSFGLSKLYNKNVSEKRPFIARINKNKLQFTF